MAKSNYENLISIVTVGSVVVIASGFFGLTKQYPPQFIHQVFQQQAHNERDSGVQGYVRPGATTQRNQSHAVSTDQKVNTVDLLAELSQQDRQTLQMRFDQAASLLHAGQFEYAITALDEVIKIQPRMPEAYVNMGYAYLGLSQFETAAGAFSRAIDLRPGQVNAYYGLAEAFEGAGDYEGALGAMRSYVHLTPQNDPFRAKAQAAIWEWEVKLGRKPSIEEQQKGISFDPRRFSSPH